MIAIFVLFCLSGAGIAGLFTHKIYELKKGETLISSAAGARERADAVVATALAERKDVLIKKARDAVGAFFVNCRKAIQAAFLTLLHKTHGALTRLLERMKGRTSMRTSGTRASASGAGANKNNVSFFLKNVQEYKDEMKKAPDATSSIDQMK